MGTPVGILYVFVSHPLLRHQMETASIDSTKILTRGEIGDVLRELNRKGRRSTNSQQNLIIFRLATCCGLRVSEVVGLKMANVVTGSAKPHIVIPSAIAKRKKARKVPLSWDANTLKDLEAWQAKRKTQGAVAG